MADTNAPDHIAEVGKMAPASPSPGLREQIAENANCSGLREGVIEECADAAFVHIRDHGPNGIVAAIRAIASRPVSEREDG